MLRINGKNIGDVVEVTFVTSFFGVQGQERINDRLVLLEARYRARPGDRCRVKILAQKDPGALLVAIESTVYKGDGKKSTLQYVLESLRSYRRGFGPLLQGWTFVFLNAILPKDKERLLECLLDVLEHYKLSSEETPIDYESFGREIKRLIANLQTANSDAKAQYFLRAADYCSARSEGLEVAYKMAAEARAYDVFNTSLQTHVRAELRRLKALIVDDIEKQLAAGKRGDSQSMLRLGLVRFILETATADEARKAIALIEPVYDELRWTDFFPEVARLLSMAFLRLGHRFEARFWSKFSANNVAHRRLITSLDPLLETYMRMLPEFKRRVFRNRSFHL